MLTQEFRLRSAKDISRVYSRGRSGGGQELFVKSLQTGLPKSRAVVVVGKKVSKYAVVRNLIRRRLAGELRQLWPQVAVGYDMVITVTRDISDLPVAGLNKSLSSSLANGGLLSRKQD